MVGVSGEETSGGRDKEEVRLGNQGKHQIVHDGHVVGSRMLFEASLVFVQSDIPWVVQAVLNTPVRAKHVE